MVRAMINDPLKKCLDRLQELNIGIMWDGKFWDESTKFIVRDNHIKCMLRNDTGCTSSEVEKAIDWIKRNIARACEANKHLVQDVEIKGIL
jgi:hypothetical protein